MQCRGACTACGPAGVMHRLWSCVSRLNKCWGYFTRPLLRCADDTESTVGRTQAAWRKPVQDACVTSLCCARATSIQGVGASRGLGSALALVGTTVRGALRSSMHAGCRFASGDANCTSTLHFIHVHPCVVLTQHHRYITNSWQACLADPTALNPRNMVRFRKQY